MNRTSAFTLVEVLAATVLCAAVVLAAANWSTALERRATVLRQDSDELRQLMAAATALRDDLILGSAGIGAGAITRDGLVLRTRAPDPRSTGVHTVRWRLAEGRLDRLPEVPGAGQPLVYAVGVTQAALVDGEDGRRRIRLRSDHAAVDLAVFPDQHHAP